MADYFVYLLEGKHADTIESIPYTVYQYLEHYFHGLDTGVFDIDNINTMLQNEETTNKIEQRNKEFFSSLSRNNVSIGDVLGR